MAILPTQGSAGGKDHFPSWYEHTKYPVLWRLPTWPIIEHLTFFYVLVTREMATTSEPALASGKDLAPPTGLMMQLWRKQPHLFNSPCPFYWLWWIVTAWACWLSRPPEQILSAGPSIWGPERMGRTIVLRCRQPYGSFSVLLYMNETKKAIILRKVVWVKKGMIRKTCRQTSMST